MEGEFPAKSVVNENAFIVGFPEATASESQETTGELLVLPIVSSQLTVMGFGGCLQRVGAWLPEF